MTTSNKVREQRLRMGLVQQELAVIAGVNPSMLTMIERYGYVPSEPVRRRIAEALHSSDEQLWPTPRKETRLKLEVKALD